MTATPARTIRVASVQLGLIALEVGVLGTVTDETPPLVSICEHPGVENAGPYSRIKRDDYCPDCLNKTRSTFGKGLVLGAGVKPLSGEDLAKIKEEYQGAKKTIALAVHTAEEVTPWAMPCGKSYYLAPRGTGGNNYALLAALIAKKPDKAFLGEFSFGGQPELCQVLSEDGVLILRQIARPQAVKERPKIEGLVDEKLLAIAEQFAETLCTELDPADYRNRYAEGIQELLDRTDTVTLAGGATVTAPAPTVDLAAALQAAVAAAAPAAKVTPARRRAPKKAAA